MILRLVIPTLGRSSWLPAALESARRLPFPCTPIIVAPARVVDELRSRFPAVEVRTETGAGLYGAVNTGLRAPGEWWAGTYLNDDDLLVAAGFGAMAETLRRGAGFDVAFGRVSLIDSWGRAAGALPVARHGADLPALLARGMVPLAQPGTVFRRSLFDRLGGFDESYRLAGDLDFFCRAAAAGARFEYVDALAASFRLSAGQLSKDEPAREVETRRAWRSLGGVSASRGRRGTLPALLRFRLGNLGVYLDRVRRHGFVPMRRVYERVS